MIYYVTGEWNDVKFVPIESTLYSWDLENMDEDKIKQLKVDIFESNLESKDLTLDLDDDRF